jgi:hypothetical protein
MPRNWQSGLRLQPPIKPVGTGHIESTMNLFTAPLGMFGAKAQIAALEKSVELDVVMVPFDRDDRHNPAEFATLRTFSRQQCRAN